MTRLPTRPPSHPRPVPEYPVDLLMRALQTAVPLSVLDMLLDRIETAR